MGKAIRLRGECPKNIVKLLDCFCGRYPRGVGWADCRPMSASSTAKRLGGRHEGARERGVTTHEYRQP